MASAEFQAFMAPFRQHRTLGPEQSIEELRSGYETLAARLFVPPADVAVAGGSHDGIALEWLEPADADAAVMIYAHGGGYGIGSLNTHRALVATIAKAAQLKALHFDYRLAPENLFPAAFDDCMAIYRHVLDRGVDPRRIVLAGDSAGGGLVLSMLVAIRERALPMPAGGVCLSPLTDLTHSGASVEERAARDPFVTPAGSRRYARTYLGATGDPRDVRASPLFADVHDLPPVLILVGSEEVLRDDAVRVGEKLRAAGNRGTLVEWPDMPHVWLNFFDHFPEARAAIADVASFVRTIVPRADTPR